MGALVVCIDSPGKCPRGNGVLRINMSDIWKVHDLDKIRLLVDMGIEKGSLTTGDIVEGL